MAQLLAAAGSNTMAFASRLRTRIVIACPVHADQCAAQECWSSVQKVLCIFRSAGALAAQSITTETLGKLVGMIGATTRSSLKYRCLKRVALTCTYEGWRRKWYWCSIVGRKKVSREIQLRFCEHCRKVKVQSRKVQLCFLRASFACQGGTSTSLFSKRANGQPPVRST